jgi:hypothetical protein
MKRLLTLFLLLNAMSANAATTGPAALINKEVTKLVALYTDGFGYNDAEMRRVTFGPLFDKDMQDAVAFFALGGMDNTNVHFEYIAIFAQGQGRDASSHGGPKERAYHLVATAMVGGRGTRTLDWGTAKISSGQIVVQGLRWGKGDAGCCPTVPIEVTFRLAANLVDELSPDYPVLSETEGPGQPKREKPSRPATKKGEK